MEKNATINIRINPDVKKSAETLPSRLGVPMATAIDTFLKQATLIGVHGYSFPGALAAYVSQIVKSIQSIAELFTAIPRAILATNKAKWHRRPARLTKAP
jgi:hypothetical protein